MYRVLRGTTKHMAMPRPITAMPHPIMAMPHHRILIQTNNILTANLADTNSTLTPPITRQCVHKQAHPLASTWLYGNGSR
jgi:hypothetical protein